MPREVREIAKNYMTNPKELTMGERNQGNEILITNTWWWMIVTSTWH